MKTKLKSHPIYLSLVVCLLIAGMVLGACNPMLEAEAAQKTAESTYIEPGNDTLPTAVPTVNHEDAPEPTTQLEPAMAEYTDDDFRLNFIYPADWSINVTPAGQAPGNGYPVSHVVELINGNYRTLIHIKLYWDPTGIGGAMPPGEAQKDGKATLFARSIERNLLIYRNLTKLIWYGGRFDDLELYVLIEGVDQGNYETIAIPERMLSEVEAMLSTFTRTGDPYMPPTEPTPTQPSEPVVCNLPSRLSVNDWVEVCPGLPNVIRSEPGRGPNSTILGQISGGTVIHLLEGPVCASGYYWWQVDAGMVSGWTAEGGDGVYWLEQAPMDEPAQVDGWVGTIVSTPEWPQIDDYFQMLNQGGSRYGITSTDLAIRQQLEEYRGSGRLIQVWGKLYYGRMDAYDTQIDVTSFEVFIP